MSTEIRCLKCGKVLARIEHGRIFLPCSRCSKNCGEEVEKQVSPEQLTDGRDHKI